MIFIELLVHVRMHKLLKLKKGENKYCQFDVHLEQNITLYKVIHCQIAPDNTTIGKTKFLVVINEFRNGYPRNMMNNK
jgi:hypothetical protein